MIVDNIINMVVLLPAYFILGFIGLMLLVILADTIITLLKGDGSGSSDSSSELSLQILIDQLTNKDGE